MAAILGYTGLSLVGPVNNKYLSEIPKETAKAINDWFRDNSFQKNEEEYFADLHIHLDKKEAESDLAGMIKKLSQKTDIVAITNKSLELESPQDLSFEYFRDLVTDSRSSLEYDIYADDKMICMANHQDTLYLVKGQEILTGEGIGVIAVGCEDDFPKYSSMNQLLSGIEEQEGISIMAHPYSVSTNFFKGRFRLPSNEQEEDRQYYASLVTAVEEFNSQNTWFVKSMLGSNILAARMAEEPCVNGIANSDTHYDLSTVGLAGTIFSREDIDYSSGDKFIESIKKNIGKGRYSIHTEYNNPISFGRTLGVGAVKELF